MAWILSPADIASYLVEAWKDRATAHAAGDILAVDRADLRIDRLLEQHKHRPLNEIDPDMDARLTVKRQGRRV